jgi:Nitroreductase
MDYKEDFYTVVEKRRTVRNFQNRAIEQDKLNRILECGLKAPTYNHLREWHFVFLKSLELRKRILDESGAFSRTPDKKFLNDTLSKINNEYQKQVYSYSVPLQERILLTAPEIMLVCFRMDKKLTDCKNLFDLNNFASVWLAVENILLAMAAEGLYGVTLVPFKTDVLKEIIGIPDNMEVATFIPFGYPEKEPAITQIKKGLKDTVHIDKW